MLIRHVRLWLLVLSLATAALLSAAAAPPASADRCQPEELVLGEPLMPESDSPVCYVMLNHVYPRLDCDSTSQASCQATLSVQGTWQKNNMQAGQRIADAGLDECFYIYSPGNYTCVSWEVDGRRLPD